jgi:hypothetical protein
MVKPWELDVLNHPVHPDDLNDSIHPKVLQG